MPEVTYTLEIENEHIQVEGNASATDDDELDREIANEIIERLERGDLWAWCCVKVTAALVVDDLTFEGVDYLGGCSYADEDDFKRGGYWESMKDQALDDLRVALRSAVARGQIAGRLVDRL